jgi:hypothetical protein
LQQPALKPSIFSIGFGFAALIYVSLEIFREFYVDFVDFCREIRVFMRFGSPHHAKCHQNLANSTPHDPNSLGTRSKPLWTFPKMDLTLLLMEEMEKLMKVMDSAPEIRSSARLLQPQKHHHYPSDTPPTMEPASTLHSNGDPPLRSPQPPLKSSIFPSNSDSPHSVTLFWKFPEYYT